MDADHEVGLMSDVASIAFSAVTPTGTGGTGPV